MSKQVKLPSGWKLTTLGEIADVIGGGTPKTNIPEYFEGGTIPWITPADLSGYTNKHISSGGRFITEEGLKNSSARMMPAGTILFTSRAPVGYVAIAANPVCTNQGFKSFVLKEDISPDYVYWYLKGCKELAESMASGTTFLELSGAKAKQIPIPVAPPEDQKRIVAEIEKQFSRLDEAVASLKRIQANLKRYKAAVLKAAVEGKLTEQWRKDHPDVEPADQLLKRILAERRAKWEAEELAKIKAKGIKPKDDSWKKKYKEPPDPDMANLPILPEGWQAVGIEQILHATRDAMKTGPFGSLLKKHEHQPDGIPVLGIENIQSMQFVAGSKIHITEEKAEDLHGYVVSAGDIIISRSGTVGEICVVPDDINKAIISTNLMKLSLAKNAVVPSFFTYLFNGSPYVLKQVSDLCKGSTRDFLNQDILKRLTIILPPMREQMQIDVEIRRLFSVIEEISSSVNRIFNRAQCLKSLILRQAFGSYTQIESLGEGAREQKMTKKKLPTLPPARKTDAEDTRIDLLSILIGYPDGVSPERLFVEAGYQGDQVDQFYHDLLAAKNELEEIDIPDDTQEWPSKQVFKIKLGEL